MNKTKKSIFDTPLLSTKIKSAQPTLFPEAALGYFLGPTMAMLANSVLSAYFNKYLTDILNLSAWASTFITWLPLVSVIFVVLGNILVGRLMDHSKTRAGKARPLILIAIPLAVLALLVLFVISPFSTDTIHPEKNIATLVCIAIGYNLWYAVAYPFYFTSHSALVSLSTRNTKARSLVATISNATNLAAIGLVNMIGSFFLGFLFVTGADGAIDPLASYQRWKIFVIILMVVNTLGALIEYYFTRERITEENMLTGEQMKKSVPVKVQLAACVKDKFWWIMIAFFFLYQFGGMMKNVAQLYFCTAWYPDANGVASTATGGIYNGTISIIGAVPTALGMVIAWPLSNKIGKGRTILLGAVLAVIGGLIGFIAPDNFAVVCTSFVIKALGSTPSMYLQLAMLADVLDHQEAKNKFRTDGLTMTIYGAIMAGMIGVANGVLNGVIGAAGYSSTNLNGDSVKTAVEILFIGVETACYLIIAVMFIFMNVEKHSEEDHKTILANQKAAVEAAGGVWEDPADRMKREEAEAAAEAEEARKADLKAKCEKKHLDYEAEEAKYQQNLAAKKAKAEAKKAAAEAKKKK